MPWADGKQRCANHKEGGKKNKKGEKRRAPSGNRTRVYCLGSNNANHYTNSAEGVAGGVQLLLFVKNGEETC